MSQIVSGELFAPAAAEESHMCCSGKLRCWIANVFFLAAMTLPLKVLGAPIYYVNHNADSYGNTGPNETVGPQNTPIDYDFPYQVTYFTGANSGEVYADVNSGTIGIYARAYNNTIYAPARQEVAANFTFDVIFSSPGSDPIDVVMNMNLRGNISEALDNSSDLLITAGTSSLPSGFYSETFSSSTNATEITRNGILSGFTADGTDQTITSNPMNVPVNTPVAINLGLKTSQGYHYQSPTISFGNTLSLIESGNVFTISGPNAANVSVNSTDAGIVDNRFGQGIPEPSTFVLAIFSGCIVLHRRRQV